MFLLAALPPEVFRGHSGLVVVWGATYIFCVVPEFVMSWRLRSSEDAKRSDRGSKAVVIVAANFAVGMGFAAAALLPSLAVGAGWKVYFYVGICVWIGGSIFRWYSIRTLGKFFTFDVAVSKGQFVIDRGPYRWIRHPSYLGSLLGQIGFGMTLTNWLAMVLPAMCLAAAYVYRIRIEEQSLLLGLGPDYRAYMQRTRRLIPFVF